MKTHRIAATTLVAAALALTPVTASADPHALVPTNGTTTIDGIDVVATARYSCGSDDVEVLPTSMTPVNGNYPVLALGQVWDSSRNQWLVSPQWYQVDGITTLTFSIQQRPEYEVYLTYAVRNAQGTWDETAVWVPITDDLDNSGPFCQ